MPRTLSELLLHGTQAVASVAPSYYLNARYPSLAQTMRFIETTPQAAYAERRLRQLFKEPNWALDAKKLEAFFQLAGEVQFWMLAKARRVALERVPESTEKTADLKMVGSAPGLPRFEVKTLSPSGGGWLNLAKMADDSFKAQLEIQSQISRGDRIAMAEHEISPHGEIERGKEHTGMSKNLIDKCVGNIKTGQYAAAPTFMVVNLMLIDGHFTGTADLRPVAAGYPQRWSVRTGTLWTVGFGSVGQLVHRIPEFEGLPGLEGQLGRQGVLSHPDFKVLAGLLFVVHPLRGKPKIYGLMREEDREGRGPHVVAAFDKLVGSRWNDELDSNGWKLTKH